MLQSLNSLLNGNNIRRKLRNHALKNSLVDLRALWRRFNGVVSDNVDLVVEVEQTVRSAHDNTAGSDTTQDDGVDLLRAQHFLERVAGAGVVARLLVDDVPGGVVDVEGWVEERLWVERAAQHASCLGEWGVSVQLGLLVVGEVDASEDGEWWWLLLVDGIDPVSGVLDKGFAFGCVGDATDETGDQVEVQDGVVLAEVDGFVGWDG